MRLAGRGGVAGRAGASYSLLTKEEMPYLLDLHLFLGRPLGPAPLQSLQAAAALADSLPPDSSLYGCFPQVPQLPFPPAFPFPFPPAFPPALPLPRSPFVCATPFFLRSTGAGQVVVHPHTLHIS